MTPNQPKPTARELMKLALKAARRINAIPNRVIREADTIFESEKLGIDPNEFRRLLRADQPPN